MHFTCLEILLSQYTVREVWERADSTNVPTTLYEKV